MKRNQRFCVPFGVSNSVVPALAVGLLLALSPAGLKAEEALIGADEYAASCLACHGVGGRGDGPMAEFLTVQPTDLTQISTNNEGVFPLLEVFQVIDGRTTLGAHGVRHGEGWEMPVWGARYKAEAGDKFGPYGGEAAVRARVLELVFYIQSIQQP
ncbi:MAG: cytochrome c [Dinoroseobacter sp.]|nr:cytochrome c [Dinoroseobacter sp.]